MRRILFIYSFLILSNVSFAQKKYNDTLNLKKSFLFNLNNTFQYAAYKNPNPNIDPRNYNQFYTTLIPRVGFFINESTVVGVHGELGWYWSNFNQTKPVAKVVGYFGEIYFTKWKHLKWNQIKVKKQILLFHPFFNVSRHYKNFYYGVDSVTKNLGPIFNKNTNKSTRLTVGTEFEILKKRLVLNIEIGKEWAEKPNIINLNTKPFKSTLNTEIEIAYLLKNQKKI